MGRFTVRIVHVTPKQPGIGRVKRHVVVAVDGEDEKSVRRMIEAMAGFRVEKFLYLDDPHYKRHKRHDT